MTDTRFIPIFPVKLVLFPRQQLPLRIFEPRYKQLVDDCMMDGTPFGVCLIDESKSANGWESPQMVGTMTKIIECRDVSLGGSELEIITLGRSSFKILRVLPPSIPKPANYDPRSEQSQKEIYTMHEQIGMETKMYTQARVEMIPELNINISLGWWEELVRLWKHKITTLALPKVVDSQSLDHLLEQYYLNTETPTLDYVYSLSALAAKNPIELQPILEAKTKKELIERVGELFIV